MAWKDPGEGHGPRRRDDLGVGIQAGQDVRQAGQRFLEIPSVEVIQKIVVIVIREVLDLLI